MDLVCLLIALPLTVLMEALYGPNPFTAKDAQRVNWGSRTCGHSW